MNELRVDKPFLMDPYRSPNANSNELRDHCALSIWRLYVVSHAGLVLAFAILVAVDFMPPFWFAMRMLEYLGPPVAWASLWAPCAPFVSIWLYMRAQRDLRRYLTWARVDAVASALHLLCAFVLAIY